MLSPRQFFFTLQAACARFITFAAGHLCPESAEWLAKRIGDIAYLISSRRRFTALENIERAFGQSITPAEKKRLARLSFQHTTLALLELYTFPKIKKRAAEKVSFTGNEHLLKAFGKGKGVIFVISHVGSWELLAFVPYLLKHPCSVIVKSIKNPVLDKRTNDLRRMFALNPIPKKNSSRTILRELKNNHLVAILIDQWAGREGVWANFFGAPTSTTSIPARLAKKTGAALIPARCLRKGPGLYHVEIDPEVSLEEGDDWEIKTTLKLNGLLEEAIRKNPQQWIWGHRRWKPKPESLRVPENFDGERQLS